VSIGYHDILVEAYRREVDDVAVLQGTIRFCLSCFYYPDVRLCNVGTAVNVNYGSCDTHYKDSFDTRHTRFEHKPIP
jgi:hypothetical protein